jgi:hypothetical protein
MTDKFIGKSQIKTHWIDQERPEIFEEWAAENGMEINPGKSKAIIFTSAQAKRGFQFTAGSNVQSRDLNEYGAGEYGILTGSVVVPLA